jgi:hypothetical protein
VRRMRFVMARAMDMTAVMCEETEFMSLFTKGAEYAVARADAEVGGVLPSARSAGATTGKWRPADGVDWSATPAAECPYYR